MHPAKMAGCKINQDLAAYAFPVRRSHFFHCRRVAGISAALQAALKAVLPSRSPGAFHGVKDLPPIS